jgi:hypothetical protein
VACTLFFLVIAYFYFPETKRKTLEEIAASFGDRVIDAEDVDADPDAKPNARVVHEE